jgi:hypothetical protein
VNDYEIVALEKNGADNSTTFAVVQLIYFFTLNVFPSNLVNVWVLQTYGQIT